jgi:hypothetical protein
MSALSSNLSDSLMIHVSLLQEEDMEGGRTRLTINRSGRTSMTAEKLGGLLI